ncbi:LysM domain-containing protein [Pseudarthrobacter sp. B907]|uniref:LysM peptidoglycan-binding domain-containing protein n=1 Tax=Pseudarthrobacter sp. B907 TaxID=3158261 RepID=UPI0032DBD6C9
MQMAPRRHELSGNRRKLQTILRLLLAAMVLLVAWPAAAMQGRQAPGLTAATAAAEVAAGTEDSVSEQTLAPRSSAVPSTAPSSPAPEVPAAQVSAPVAAPAAPTDAAAASAIESNQYVVAPGDTVGAIAARFGLDVATVLVANGLGAFTPIMPGQTLKLSGPAIAAPAAAPAPSEAPAAAAAVAPAARTIFVAGSGGQAMVDRCIGPIHFTPTDAYSLFITEHDFCGGWARFSGISVGETVVVSGYGTYTATGRGQVGQGGSTNDVAAVFGGFPRAILQTCIPGTNQMLLIALN